MKTKQIFIFMPLINNFITIGLRFFAPKYISNHITKYNHFFAFLI